MSNSRISVCFASRSLGRKVVQMSSETSTEELSEIATREFGQPVASLKFGFPPRSIEVSPSIRIGSLIPSSQERVQVEFADPGVGMATPAKPDGAPAKRSKRAAAQRATESMPAVIRAQEEAMKKIQPHSSRRGGGMAKISRGGSSRISGFSAPAPAASSGSKGKKGGSASFSKPSGPGRRLNDGTIVSPSRKRKAGSSIVGGPSSSDSPTDLSESLLGALNHKGKMGSVLRRGMKNAVQASYETSKTFSRLAAIQSKKYSMEDIANSNQLRIAFHGSVDKQEIVDTVDSIPRDVLEAVIRGIHASHEEALRPENLALLSPRVLWNLVRAFPSESSIGDCYKALLPELDWKFLRRRAVQLSEKAKENLRQQQEADEDEGDEIDGDRAAEAIQAVEDAMENLESFEKADRRSRVADAALRRLENNEEIGETTTEEWKLVTPTEFDRDELEECIQQAPPSDPTAVEQFVESLARDCSIHNWRELANTSDIAGLAATIGAKTENVQKWVEYAQDKSVDEIIVEICDSLVDVVENMTIRARTGTPKDLAGWRQIPGSLHSLLQSSDPTVTADRVQTWCHRAYHLLSEYEWLNWYATPVE